MSDYSAPFHSSEGVEELYAEEDILRNQYTQNRQSRAKHGAHASADTIPDSEQEFFEEDDRDQFERARDSHQSVMHKRNGLYRPEHALHGFENDRIAYLKAQSLAQPLDTPKPVKIAMIIGVIVAACIGWFLLSQYFDFVFGAPQREQAALEEVISQDIDKAIPDIASLMPLDDQTIMNTLVERGLTLFERVPIGMQETGGFEIIKLPPDVTIEQAGAMYAAGIEKASPSSAARLLNGSWDLTVSREYGPDIRLRYADFQSQTLDEAVENALVSQGLTSENIADSGVDDAGNTYAMGVVDTESGSYSWRISAVQLKEIYNINGLPEDSYFVGIRYTDA